MKAHRPFPASIAQTIDPGTLSAQAAVACAALTDANRAGDMIKKMQRAHAEIEGADLPEEVRILATAKTTRNVFP